MKTFLIKYDVRLKDASGLFGKEMKIKNRLSGFQAQCRLEEFLKKKFSNFESLIVKSCKEDYSGVFGNMFGAGADGFPSGFSDIFGGKK
jgi:hypothetical protein